MFGQGYLRLPSRSIQRRIQVKRFSIVLAALAAAIASQAQIAYDTAENAVYVVGQEYIQVGTELGNQTAATNGLNGGFGFNKWQRGGYGDGGNFGSTLITNVPASFHMGTKQFGIRSGVNGDNFSGADARRRFNEDFVVGQKLTFSIMPGGNGAGTESSKGDFGIEFRSGLLSNPGRDMFAINGSKGQFYSILDITGYRFTTVPVTAGQRVDVEVTSSSVNNFTIKLTPFGETGSSYDVVSISSDQNVNLRTIQFYAYQTDGDSYANFLRIDGAGVAVSGKVTLENFDVSPAGQVVKFELVDGSNNVVETANATLDANGNYTFQTSKQGSYKVAAKGSHWLRKLSSSVTIGASGASNVNLSLKNGDIDGDNSITVFDYSVLSDYFDKSSSDADWNTVGGNGFAPNAADLDGDGSITVFDYSILSDNFDLSGD